MTIQIKHAFTSAKGDGGDATLVRPSNWNAVHTTTMAAGNLLGRLTAGPGSFEEIPISAYMAALLSTASASALADVLGIFRTGDVKWSYDIVTRAGWITCQIVGGTIGNAVSSATIRANADTQSLFELIYNNCNDAIAPVSGGRTGNATNDFNAGKRITMNLSGRSPIGSGGAGSGISSRDVGVTGGTETHTLLTAEIPSHFHSAGIFDPGHTHGHNAITGTTSTGGGGFQCGSNGGATISANASNVRVTSSNGLDTTGSTGSGGAHNNLHNFIALVAHVKL